MTLYTMGYSGRTAPELEAEVKKLDATVYDVRLKPFARVPAFRGGALRALLGNSYIHARGLGNINYKNGGKIELADPDMWIAQIEARLQAGENIILLCGCKYWEECHRTVVAELIEKNIGVEAHHYECK